MNKRKWIWVITILLALVSLPGLYERHNVEVQNNTYELVIPYHEIASLTKDESITIDEALSTLSQSGLTTVSLRTDSLSRWFNNNIIDLYGQKTLEGIVRFKNEPINLIEEEGFYITVPEDSYYRNKILTYFDVTEITIGGEPLYFIPGEMKQFYASIGYNQQNIDKVKSYGLDYTLRIQNEDDDVNLHTLEEISAMNDENFSRILFSGGEVVGYPNADQIRLLADQLHQSGYGFYAIEPIEQQGIHTVARQTNYKIVRLHSLDLNERSLDYNVDRTIRAVKERNIRSIFVHIPVDKPLDDLAYAATYLKTVQKQMPGNFQSGTAEPFSEIDSSYLFTILLLVAGILFTYLAAEILKNHKWRLLALVLMVVLAAGYVLLQKLLLLQAFALIIAIVAPIYAVIRSGQATTNIGKLTMQYAKGIGISFLGIVIVIGLLNSNAFLTGFELFRGVKLVFVVPMVFITIYLLWNKMKVNTVVSILKAEVKYWHLVVLVLLGGILFYYISRTGNTGSVLDIEIVIRQKLEEILYVRPRTKEFLIGFPFFLLACYVMGMQFKWGKFLLIPGVIGFLSIINTFTHLHIPIYISLLRTFYSVVLGYAIGLLLIYLFRLGYRSVSKFVESRWS